MLSLYGFGVLLWLAYGLFIDAQAVAQTNVATAILIAAATVLKAWKERRGLSRSVAPNRCANSAKPRSPEPPFESSPQPLLTGWARAPVSLSLPGTSSVYSSKC